MRVEIGQAVQRAEDPASLRGEGRYTDDLNEPGQAYAAIREERARARHHPARRTDRQINPANSPGPAGCGCAARFGEEPWAMQKALCARR
jgi:hypothetical protein